MAKKDINGRDLKIGDTVLIKGIPDALSEFLPDQKEDLYPLFLSLVGKYKRIVGFNEFNMAEIEFKLRNNGNWVYHTVWIETCLLRLKTKRNRG